MATKRLVIDGYGQLELNQVAFRRDGRIEAQCKLAAGIDFVENGMLLAIDNVSRTVGMPAGDGSDELVALNYTTEHLYDERARGLKDFKLDKNTFLPRLGYLARGDKFTTNCLSYDTTDFADDDALKAAKLDGDSAIVLYGSESADGTILLKKTTAPSNVKVLLKAVKMTTMPDGQFAIKFQAL